MKEDLFYREFLQKFEQEFQNTIQNLFSTSQDSNFDHTLIEQFLNPMIPYVKSGKRIRPLLVACGAGNLDVTTLNAGIAFELLHTFALVHDDIMDGATKRREVPTVHTVFENQNIPGESAAMLVGDFLLAAANEHMSSHVPQLMPLFTQMQRFLCIGQFYEMIHWGQKVEQQVSENIALFKSAQYSFQYPLQMGLMLANNDIHSLDTYAHYTGLAFQMRDDWLDFSNEESGKDKNLDTKNSVANIVQLTLQKNNGDIQQTKDEIQQQLLEYRTKAEECLESANLEGIYMQTLHNLLLFSSTLR
jgi:geranylgeranyl pyrophosphate synthase